MLKTHPTFALVAGTALLAAGCSSGSMMGMGAPAPAMASNGVLVTQSGMTLYTFDKDADGKSTCNGPCATMWPPLPAMSADKPSGAYSLVTREDGSMQWAYKGKPVYTYKSDAKAGDKAGDNFRGVWHAVAP